MKTNSKYFSTLQNKDALTLMEMVIAMFVFAVLASGIVSGVVQARKMSESNVREATALAVASGFMEQLHSIDYTVLLARSENDAAVDFIIRDGTNLSVRLNQNTFTGPLGIPLVASGNGDFEVFMNFWVKIDVERSSDFPALLKTIYFEWEDPFSGGRGQRQISAIRAAATVN